MNLVAEKETITRIDPTQSPIEVLPSARKTYWERITRVEKLLDEAWDIIKIL